MKKILILGLCITISLVTASSALAEMVTIPTIGNMPQWPYAGEYVGPIGATLDGTEIKGGIACVDITKNTGVPSSFGVTISTLQDMTKARHGSDAATIVKYEEAAWLLGQIPSYTGQAGQAAQVGAIQFAMWKLFDPNIVNDKLKNYSEALSAVNSWWGLATAINPQNYDFSSVRIYTPTAAYASNQEFMSGGTINRSFTGNAVPIPASFVLLASGLLGLGMLGYKKKAVLVRREKN